jgi:formamidopyrimidine-DNA glycosylase
MPELPEVETVRRGLVANVVGRRIERVEVGRDRTVRRTSPQAVIDGMTGATLTAVGRRGKYLLGELDNGLDVMIHLRMTGQLLVAAHGASPPLHTHVALHFARSADGGDREPGQLWFVDPRTFGEVVVFHPDDAADVVPELAALGVDPIADQFDRATLAAIVRRRSRLMKQLLLDQHAISGIGNIYADEILHRARIHPTRISSTLPSPTITRLHRTIGDVLRAAIVAGGSTLDDNQYVDLMGQYGSFQDEFLVYGRTGQRCVTCGRGIVRRIVTSGRSTHYCPVCQRLPAPHR